MNVSVELVKLFWLELEYFVQPVLQDLKWLEAEGLFLAIIDIKKRVD